VALVADTGVLYAALDSNDPDHSACAALIGGIDEQIVIPVLVLFELDYWLRKFATPDAWLALAEDAAAGVYVVYPLDSQGLLRCAQLQQRYSDLPLDVTDASVFVTCELLGERKVATLDRRHFAVLRTQAGVALELLP
jgi:hypothetical protein